MEINRKIRTPTRSFFLFGPRGTGKSTWLRKEFPEAKIFDLLRSEQYLSLLRNPEELRHIVTALPPNSWVVIDEVQKLPNLLDEVHALIADYKDKYKFALTGSSARRLKRGNANMLAGRAQTHQIYPLTVDELGSHADLESLLKFGSLPEVVTLRDDSDRIEFLQSYVQTYLKEEIQIETKVRDLLGFTRFLDVAAIMNGQQLNLSNMSREVGLARSTVQGHFSILIDTLLGTLVDAYQPRAKVKEVSLPKFYFFDAGVVNALKGALRSPLEAMDRGYLFETLFLNELRALNSYSRCGGSIHYWRTADGNEVDFILKIGKEAIGFEVKSTTTWKSTYNFGLRTLLDSKKLSRAYGIYAGNVVLQQENIMILPLKDFSGELKKYLVGSNGT